MKYLKLFEEFITESGNSIEQCVPFEQDEIQPTLDWLTRNIFPKIGIVGIGDDAAIIGSAGKKIMGEKSGDIDISISADKIAGYLKVPLESVLFSLNDVLKKDGHSTKLAPGFNQVSIGAPIAGDYKRGVGQVDLMLTTDLEWSKFIYHSPDFRKAESRYKGAYRNILLMSAIGKSFFKNIKTTESGSTVEYETYVVRLNQGVVQIRKSFEGKNGLKKTADLLRQYDALITKTPSGISELLFGNQHVDMSTYEKLYDALHSSAFKYQEKLKSIMDEFNQKIMASGLPLPTYGDK